MYFDDMLTVYLALTVLLCRRSFECLEDEGGTAVPAVQHCWNVTSGATCHVTGLVPGATYRIFVVANYGSYNTHTTHTHTHGNTHTHTHTTTTTTVSHETPDEDTFLF